MQTVRFKRLSFAFPLAAYALRALLPSPLIVVIAAIAHAAEVPIMANKNFNNLIINNCLANPNDTI